MELRVLQYFLAVAREQSIIRAAESLHLSQPTLSTQLKAMEEELGNKGFQKSHSYGRRYDFKKKGGRNPESGAESQTGNFFFRSGYYG